jgi:YhcG PDDEXK nuclease domain
MSSNCAAPERINMVSKQVASSGQCPHFFKALSIGLRHEQDEPTIGIILCKSKDKTIVEYALQGSKQPIGVSTYQLQSQLPPNFQNNLPTVEQLEMELTTVVDEERAIAP